MQYFFLVIITRGIFTEILIEGKNGRYGNMAIHSFPIIILNHLADLDCRLISVNKEIINTEETLCSKETYTFETGKNADLKTISDSLKTF